MEDKKMAYHVIEGKVVGKKRKSESYVHVSTNLSYLNY